MMRLDVNNPPKFYLLLVALAGIFVLMALGRLDAESPQAWAAIGSIVGYGVGNGVAARKGQPVEPVFRNRTRDAGRITLDLVAGWALLFTGTALGVWGICYLLSHI